MQAVHKNREFRTRLREPGIRERAHVGTGFAVVLRGAVGLGNHLRHERDSGAGADEAGADHLAEAGGRAAAVRPAAAAAALRRPGAEELGAVDRRRAAAADLLHPLRAAAEPEPGEDHPEDRDRLNGVDLVKALAHRRVSGRATTNSVSGLRAIAGSMPLASMSKPNVAGQLKANIARAATGWSASEAPRLRALSSMRSKRDLARP